MGVAGAGKTTVGRMLALRLGWDFYDADDFHSRASIGKMKKGISLTDEDRLPWLKKLRGLIKESLAGGRDAVIACSALKESYREMLANGGEPIRFVHLRGGRNLIQERLRKRKGHFAPALLLKGQFKDLEEPTRALRIPADKPPRAIVSLIMKELRGPGAKIAGARGALYSVRMRGESKSGGHITGAEGIYDEEGLIPALEGYTQRALGHPKGRPERVFITIERLRGKPLALKALPVRTLECGSSREASLAVREILRGAGISVAAIKTAYEVVRGRTMRGATLVGRESGRRLELDTLRGVRVSKLGMKKEAEKALSARLSRLGLNTLRVKEALTLATKAANAPGVVAELCISDDPDYTTGYVASKEIGYLRIPHIKAHIKGSAEGLRPSAGGRVFFVEEDADIEVLADYLERKTVFIK